MPPAGMKPHGTDISLVRLQSAAMLSIFEQYQRRSESCPTRLIGALIGAVAPYSESEAEAGFLAKMNSSGPLSQSQPFVAEVRHCFPIPHSEVGDQVSINSEYYRTRVELHKKSHGKDALFLGWYSIQLEGQLPKNMSQAVFNENEVFIRDFFAKDAGFIGNPVSIHLKVTIAENGSIKYEVSSCEAINAKNASSSSSLIPYELAFGMAELHIISNMSKLMFQDEGVSVNTNGKLLISLPSFDAKRVSSKKDFDAKIAIIKQYYEKVKSGALPTNAEIDKKVSFVIKSLGLDSDGKVKKTLEENSKEFVEVLSSLKSVVEATDKMLLS